ncbi:hypothetical protein QYE76_010048 [Lolium multiflorum]|uniref:Protein FAR1-RELATED SEQUENCE n=1 Tax=Lolium multiflorum TaxID=4521 RepID=A0AAD8TSY5_LOLMU|nr:hypothetical protein QYE76_010048 [Lolium multiflorum]
MPFGLIIGVNSHFQSVIFGRVLLREEKVKKFEWVFREFVKMMGGKNPVTILTDQCRAMEVAISNVLLGTNHRWCKWHVLRKAKERLGALYGKNNQFEVDFHRIVNQMLTMEEFEGAWVEMLSTYALEKNPYLHHWRVYKCGSFYVDEVVPGEMYVAKHFDSQNREKWCKAQVLVHLRFTEVPAQYVLKRWTVGIRDVLPTHLVYQKYQGLMTSFSFRHSQLYLNCM